MNFYDNMNADNVYLQYVLTLQIGRTIMVEVAICIQKGVVRMVHLNRVGKVVVYGTTRNRIAVGVVNKVNEI